MSESQRPGEDETGGYAAPRDTSAATSGGWGEPEPQEQATDEQSWTPRADDDETPTSWQSAQQ